MNEPNLSALLDETEGVVGVMLGTVEGELRGVIGKIAADSDAASIATVARELSAIGTALGLGELGLLSLKAPTATRAFVQRSSDILAIELEPRSALGPVELKLRALAWTPEDVHRLALQRTPTARRRAQTARFTSVRAEAERPPSRAAAGTPTELPVVRAEVPVPVFTGDLDEFGIPDLLEFLRTSQRTGLLTCATSEGTGMIQLARGMIVSASSPNALDLREHLLSSPEIGEDQRRALADLPPESFRDDIVNCAVSRELVAQGALERARVARVHSAVREMIGWASGRFSFDPGAPVLANPALVLSSQSILMKIYQELDEQSAGVDSASADSIA